MASEPKNGIEWIQKALAETSTELGKPLEPWDIIVGPPGEEITGGESGRSAKKIELTPTKEPEEKAEYPDDKEATTFRIYYSFKDLPDKQKEEVLNEIQRIGNVLIYDPEWVNVDRENERSDWFLGMTVEHKNIFKDTGDTQMKEKMDSTLNSIEIPYESIDEYPDEEWGRTEYIIFFKEPRFSMKVSSSHLKDWRDEKLQGYLKYKALRSLKTFFKNPLKRREFRTY